MEKWQKRKELVAIKKKPHKSHVRNLRIVIRLMRFFFTTFFLLTAFLSFGPHSVLLHMLYATRPEYRPVINLLFYPAAFFTATGIFLPRVIALIEGIPRNCDHWTRRDYISGASKALMVVSWAAVLLWGSRSNAAQNAPYCDYILAVSVSIVFIMFTAMLVNSFLSAVFGRVTDSVVSAAKYSYAAILLPVFTLMFTCSLSPLGPMSYSTKYHFWILHPCARVSINSKTTRGPEFSAKKPAGTYRIAVMGDSSAFGLWHRYEDTFAALLGEKLNASAPRGRRYEILNAGVPTHRVKSVSCRYKQAVRPYDPDMLFIYAGHNDSRVDPNRFRRTLLPILRESRHKRRPVLIATYPHLECTVGMHLLAEEVRLMAKDYDLYLIDLEDLLDHDPKYFCGNGIHPNKTGHMLIARRVYALIKKIEKEKKLPHLPPEPHK